MNFPWRRKSAHVGSGRSGFPGKEYKAFAAHPPQAALVEPGFADTPLQRNERSELYQHFSHFAWQLLESFDIDTFLRGTLDLIIEWKHAERGMIILFDEEGNPLFESARNISQGELSAPKDEISLTLITRARESGRAICLENALEEPELRKSASVVRLKILSVICLPLKHGERIIGVVYLDNRTVMGAFKQHSCRDLEEFGGFLALAAFRALERKQLKNHVAVLEEQLRARYRLEALVGHHPRMVQVFKILAQVADTDATVLILGESGTGKELVARAVHYNNRQRSSKPFIPVNCGAIPEALLESELFGYTRGAFTGALQDKMGWFESARGGTIFLDEVNELALPLQVKLLRILQTGEYSRVGSTEIRFCNVRVVAAASRDLKACVREGLFREELYYRLNVIEIELPPLRERRSDILLLALHFLDLYGKKYDKPNIKISPEAEAALTGYDFPGNVRELENIIQREVLLAAGNLIDAVQLPEIEPRLSRPIESGTTPLSTYREAKKEILGHFEKSYIEGCLRSAHGNITKAAAMAGMNIKNFYLKMQNNGLDPHDFRKG